MPSTQDTSAELMTAYLDAELGDEDAAAFEEALENDPEAKSELEQLRRVMSLVSTLPDVEAPPDFYDKVSKRIRKRQRFALDNNAWILISLPFQVLSIIVILTVAGLYMMAELEKKPQSFEREAIPGTMPEGEGAAGPAPVEP